MTYINQYKNVIYLTWMILYLIFPAWALPVSVSVRALVFSGLILYFCISAWLLNRWFNECKVVKPVCAQVTDWRKLIKNNSWLVIVCSLSTLLHINPIFNPVLLIGDEALHLQSGLWMYEYIDSNWHGYFQILFWALIGWIVIIKKMNLKVNSFSVKRRAIFCGITSDDSVKYFAVFLLISFLFIYFYLLRNLAYYPMLIRYPPVSKFLYFIAYSAFGINHIFPRILQLIFYLLCTVYLYRTICLFYDKETALLGASMYLFLPVTFCYAHLGEIESGVIFIIAAISFYFLRFIKERDNRDLLLTVYLTGTGYLYKDPVFLVFPVCLALLIYKSLKKHNLYPLMYIKILLLAPLSVVPWMIIQKLFSWRHYTFQMSNLTSIDSKIVTYFSLMAWNLSTIVFVLFVLSIMYACFIRRNILTVYFGFLFIIYYFFIVSDVGALSPRFSMVFYPTIVVFLSIFISDIMKNIPWRHAFKLCFIVLTVYLIIISSNKHFLSLLESKKLQYYPSATAMKWVKENVKDGEKILSMRIMSADFYRVKFRIDKSKIIALWYELGKVSTPEKLKAFYENNSITYIMFPYGPKYPYSQNSHILYYLKENQDKEFVEIAKFNMNDNVIYIYKLKEI